MVSTDNINGDVNVYDKKQLMVSTDSTHSVGDVCDEPIDWFHLHNK